jgi:hypothetical protein
MKEISLITVYNNEKLLNEMMASVKKQNNVAIDLVMINNINGKFTSAAKALNYGVTKARSDVYVFLHQDIEFLDENVLNQIYDYAVKNKNIVFGSAGVQDKNIYKSPKVLSDMCGENGEKYGTIIKPTRAFTLDECLIACHKNCFDTIKFDENICNGWHLYGADLCLQAQVDDNLDVVALPMNVWHKSNGNADKAYFKTQNKLGAKYRKYFKIINTTNGYVYTNIFKRILQNIYRKIKY